MSAATTFTYFLYQSPSSLCYSQALKVLVPRLLNGRSPTLRATVTASICYLVFVFIASGSLMGRRGKTAFESFDSVSIDSPSA